MSCCIIPFIVYTNAYIHHRDVIADSEDTIKAAASALGKHGFINYFGLQVSSSDAYPYTLDDIYEESGRK